MCTRDYAALKRLMEAASTPIALRPVFGDTYRDPRPRAEQEREMDELDALATLVIAKLKSSSSDLEYCGVGMSVPHQAEMHYTEMGLLIQDTSRVMLVKAAKALKGVDRKLPGGRVIPIYFVNTRTGNTCTGKDFDLFLLC